eukprot:scaffold12005_cov55-Attheya_sp.AAC.2
MATGEGGIFLIASGRNIDPKGNGGGLFGAGSNLDTRSDTGRRPCECAGATNCDTAVPPSGRRFVGAQSRGSHTSIDENDGPIANTIWTRPACSVGNSGTGT